MFNYHIHFLWTILSIKFDIDYIFKFVFYKIIKHRSTSIFSLLKFLFIGKILIDYWKVNRWTNPGKNFDPNKARISGVRPESGQKFWTEFTSAYFKIYETRNFGQIPDRIYFNLL